MRKEEVEDAPNVITGNFSIRTHSVEILFDSGATHSFIYARLVETLWLVVTYRYSLSSIALSDGKVMSCRELFIDLPILIHGHDFLLNLYKFELTQFDIILGMNWLSKHQAHMDYLKLKITLIGPKREGSAHGKPLGGWSKAHCSN